MPLPVAIARYVRPRMHLHFASSPSRSNAAVRALAHAFRRLDPEFVFSATGFHSTMHLLPILRLGKRYISCFFGDNYPTPRPNPIYGRLEAEGVELEHWSLWSYTSALRAGALGQTYAVTNSLSGTTLGEELAIKGKFTEVVDPVRPDRNIALVAAIRPSVAFVHAAAGDREGNVLASPPYSEGYWGALAAECGVIVTVDQLVDRAVLRGRPDWLKLPPYRVLAICEEPFGAHPQPSYFAALAPEVMSYSDDFEHYEIWRRMTTDAKLFASFSRHVLEVEDPSSGYREFVGRRRLEALRSMVGRRSSVFPRAGQVAGEDSASSVSLSSADQMVILAARTIARRAIAGGYRAILAGIGTSFAAARLAKLLLKAQGLALEVMVETGMSDIECGPTGHPFLLASSNMAQAARLSSIEDVLGTLTCGAHNRCIGVLGAAEIDTAGNINSTRLASGQLLVGSGGANDIASSCREVVAVVRCDPSRLVDRVHYVTSPGKSVLHIATERCVLSRGSATDIWSIGDVCPGAASLTEALGSIRENCRFSQVDTHGASWAEPPSRFERQMLAAIRAADAPAVDARVAGAEG
ncbi:MAG TPA: CoA-transferase [Polyangiaceae bacterium]